MSRGNNPPPQRLNNKYPVDLVWAFIIINEDGKLHCHLWEDQIASTESLAWAIIHLHWKR